MKNLLIAIDTGKHSTKIVHKINDKVEKNIFRTKIQEVNNLGIELTKNSYNVGYENRSYLIGDMLSEDKCDYNISKSSLNHQLCIYLSICNVVKKVKAMESGVPNIYLGINVPINIYKNNILKKQYKELIEKNNQIITMKVNDVSYLFKIKDVVLLPEATASVYSDVKKFRNKKVTVIDCGSLNTTYCVYNNLVPQFESMIVANSGINVLRSKIAETLSTFSGILISNDDTEQILKEGFLCIDGERIEESKNIIEDLIQKHVLEIFNYAKSRNVSFNNTELVFTGGGSILLKDYILNRYPNAIFEDDPQFANAFSFYSVLDVKYGKK